jgi:ribose 1,5-bisphosphokinase
VSGPNQPIEPGAFVAVVGASGVGKDALLAEARARCGPGAHFPRRVITRPPGPGEDFESVSEAAFEETERRGGFAVSWRAHGLAYGIPAAVDGPIRAGEVVVANVSRGAIGALEERYARVVVVRITVSETVRATRLRARGRERADAVDRRLSRADPAPERVADHEIRNDGTVAEGGARLLAVITGLARREERASALEEERV